MKGKFFKSVILLLVVGSLLASPCWGAEKTSVVRVNATIGYAASTSYIIKELGLLEKHLPENLTVKWSFIATAPDTRDALVSGGIDIAEMGTGTFISAIENGLPLVALSHAGRSIANIYSNRSDIKSLKDFAAPDKIAIINRATTLHYAFMAKCQQVLGDFMALDTLLVPIPAADAIIALESGTDFDGAVLAFPNTIRIKDIKSLTLISDMNDVTKEYGIGSLYVANESFFDKNPELVTAFLKAQKEAVDFAAKEPEKAAELLAGVFQIDASYFLEALKIAPLTNVISGYDKQADLLYKAGILSQKPRPLSELKNYENLVTAK